MPSTEGNAVARAALSKRSNIMLVTVNAVAICLFMLTAVDTWPIAGEEGLNSTTAEPFIWALTTLPVLLIALIVNVLWGAMVLVRRQWSSARVWSIVVCFWFLVVVVDFLKRRQ